MGISKDGGLFVPKEFPKISASDIEGKSDKEVIDYLYARAEEIYASQVGTEKRDNFIFTSYYQYFYGSRRHTL